MLRVAVVGAGPVMQMVHLPSLRALSGVEVVALAELDRSLGERVAAAFGIGAVYGDVGELLAAGHALDGVVVVCGKQWHASATLPVLRAGLPVFTEKPLAGSLAQGREMVEAARGGSRLMVGYMKRFDPAVIEADRLLRAGAIGEVRFVRVHDWGGDYVCRRPTVGGVALVPPVPRPADSPPRASAPTPAPGPSELRRRAFDEWIEVWVHDVNLVQGLFGPLAEIRWSSSGSPRMVLARSASGVEVCFDVGGPQPGGMPWDETIEAFGTAGRLFLGFKPPFLMHARTVLRLHRPSGVEEPDCGHAEAFLEEMRHFCRCLEAGESPQTDGRMGLSDLETCARIVDAAHPGLSEPL